MVKLFVFRFWSKGTGSYVLWSRGHTISTRKDDILNKVPLTQKAYYVLGTETCTRHKEAKGHPSTKKTSDIEAQWHLRLSCNMFPKCFFLINTDFLFISPLPPFACHCLNSEPSGSPLMLAVVKCLPSLIPLVLLLAYP